MTNKKYIYIILFSVAIIFQENVFAQKGRAMWIWNSANQVNSMINNYGTYRQDLFDFCRAPHGNADNKITTLFLSCSAFIYSNYGNLQNFISEASDSGITIEYLDGDPSWATYNQAYGYDRIKKVIEYNASCSKEEQKFKGVHFDVEPYLLKVGSSYRAPYWDSDRMAVWNSFLAFNDTCQALVDSSNSNLYFGIAIPRWFESHVGIDELKKLQSKIDYVAIMDYNEKASVIISDAKNEIDHAKELNKKVWIGVETKQIEPETVSFYEEGVAFMEEQLATVNNVYGNEDVFLGFAIHSYRYYRVLKNDPVSVKKNDAPINNEFVLEQNYPNPFNPSTMISFYLKNSSNVSLSIYNLLGQKEVELINDDLSSGWHEVIFTNENLSSGVYFYELRSNEFSQKRKMILLK
ncbi:MAG: T9SS type A sorting domain-containing protein [Melioribacteraceae bacterium]|nr:T9SS type A sorting domain-containing protein [Melioribacteraceae bacterium]